MKRLLLLIIFIFTVVNSLWSQSFSTDDLIDLANTPLTGIDHFMKKKGFQVATSSSDSAAHEARYIIHLKKKSRYDGPERIVDISMGTDCKYFSLYTSSPAEYIDGKKYLVKSGFFYDKTRNAGDTTAMLFQKGNVDIEATPRFTDDTVVSYCFTLKQKKIPSKIRYAEDLLQFDSHEFLASFFGEQNVKKDRYYFSEKELRKCSVLFSGTRYQVVFIWKDQDNLDDLLYIVVPHQLPTESGRDNNNVMGSNEWQFKNGIYPGMNIKELLRLNEKDFGIFGNKSELAYMVKPAEEGKINFRKTVVVLSCSSCDDIKIFNQDEVSALDIVKKDVPMYVNDVLIYPTDK